MDQTIPKGEAQIAQTDKKPAAAAKPAPTPAPSPAPTPAKETGGPKGLEPTRYGDWEHKGRCIDF